MRKTVTLVMIGTLLAVTAGFAAAYPLVAQAEQAQVAPLPRGCEWQWAGGVTGWVLIEFNCIPGFCDPPAGPGDFVGQTKFTPCSWDQANGSCGCGR